MHHKVVWILKYALDENINVNVKQLDTFFDQSESGNNSSKP